MSVRRLAVLSAGGVVLLMLSATRAQAESFTPADVARATFRISDFALPPTLGSIEALDFSVGLLPIESVGSYTARLFDRGKLLGTYTAPYTSLDGTVATSRFISPSSTGSIVPATVIDFSSFNDRTFDGTIEFTIAQGFANVVRVSDELTVGRAFTPVDNFHNVPVRLFEITRADEPSPVPEPATLTLLATGLAATVAARRRKRSAQQVTNRVGAR